MTDVVRISRAIARTKRAKTEETQRRERDGDNGRVESLNAQRRRRRTYAAQAGT